MKFIKVVIGGILLLWVPVDCVYTFYNNKSRDSALQGETTQLRAMVINKKNYLGNSPVSQQFSYSYRFQLNGRNYEGNTRDPELRVGDSVLVKYVIKAPEVNEIISGKN